jgi:peptidoglycan/LPS O-acetylase OafA/YrhL
MSNATRELQHYGVLDGWRAVSILLVLVTHLLPIGPKSWDLNASAGVAGMALFFTLSGFLITGFLLKNDSVAVFLVRRIFRIVPLAWLYLAIALPLTGAAAAAYPANFFFYANVPPFWLGTATDHFWSLCVEVHFYACISILFGLLGVRGLRLIVPIAIAVTCYRAWTGAPVSIVTWLRIDEILAGSILALMFFGSLGQRPLRLLAWLNPYALLALLLLSSHPAGGALNYLRPYLAAALVGATLVGKERALTRLLVRKPMRYIAAISFALYVIHPLLAWSWLGSGTGWIKYIKRPLLVAALLALAHLSTFQFESRCIALGKRLSAVLLRRRASVGG